MTRVLITDNEPASVMHTVSRPSWWLSRFHLRELRALCGYKIVSSTPNEARDCPNCEQIQVWRRGAR